MALELWNDTAPASWIADSINSLGANVGSVVPCRFEAYARLLHPAVRFEGRHRVSIRWDEIARTAGRVPHPDMQWANISGNPTMADLGTAAQWNDEPAIGTLPREYARRLAQLLGPFTTTDDCVWFCVWEGWGDLKVSRGRGVDLSSLPIRPRPPRKAEKQSRHPMVNLPHRRYYLFRGRLSDVEESFGADSSWISANLWWPDDRTWFVGTGIDHSSSYLGGSAECVATVLSDRDVEAMPAECHHRISDDADVVNQLQH